MPANITSQGPIRGDVPTSLKSQPLPLPRTDRCALLFMASNNLPPQFSALATPEGVISSVDKSALRARAIELGANGPTTTTALLRSIAEIIVCKDPGSFDIPSEFASASLLRSLGGSQAKVVKCWRCGSDVDATIDHVADLQIGSYPPGDPRRWMSGGSPVVPAVICKGLTRAYPDTEPRATRPEPDAPPSAGHAPWTERMVECRVGGFRTIAGLYWSGAWRSTPEILRLARAPGDGALSDGLIEAPACVCVARAALQLLNWRSMSGEAAADQNCLPARVYLTRPCKLACRRGQVVGYVTYNSEPTKQFPLPSINATYVAPEGRRKGACREMLLAALPRSLFTAEYRSNEKGREEESEGAPWRRGAGARPLAGIEVPVSNALLAALPKMLTEKQLRRIVAVESGDTVEIAHTRDNLLVLTARGACASAQLRRASVV